MVHHPAIQHAAQAELDVVVGRGRLPNFTDRDSLPIIHAIILEALRWRPVIPVGKVPTCTSLVLTLHDD